VILPLWHQAHSRPTAPDRRKTLRGLRWTIRRRRHFRKIPNRRPALVISPAVSTEHTGLAVVCPITSRVRPFPTSVVLPPGLPITGEILVSHIRSIDTMAGPIRYAGAAVPTDVAQLVRAKLNAFITI
jgi:mRNA interferase MazF